MSVTFLTFIAFVGPFTSMSPLGLGFWCSVVGTQKIRTLRTADDERLAWKVSERSKDSTGTGLSE